MPNAPNADQLDSNQPDHFIIAVSGSRAITDQARVWEILDSECIDLVCAGFPIFLRLGDAPGVDLLALQWARDRSIPHRIYFAAKDGYGAWCESAPLITRSEESAVLCSDWDDPREGVQAGFIRNSAMIGVLNPSYRPVANLLIAIWDGYSDGTRHCMAQARNAGTLIHQYSPVEVGRIMFRSRTPVDDELVQYLPL